MDQVDDFFVGMALGVRFRANFSIEDQMGRIVDEILYSKGSYFNSTIFPQVRGTIGTKALYNQENQNRIQIDNSNIILDINFDDNISFSKSQAPQILKKFEEQIVRGIMTEFKIREIVRIGYLKRYLYKIEDLASTFVDKTIGNTLGGINDINLSFSKKYTTADGLVLQTIDDYDNAIFNVIKKADLKEIFMAIDYQRYFNPFLASAADLKMTSFIERAESFNTGSYLDWLNKNYLESVNA